MPTFTFIGSVTVGSGGAATIDFTSIPGTYTDLCLKVSLRSTSAGAEAAIIQFNGSTTGFSGIRLAGSGITDIASSDTLANIRAAIDTAADTSSTFSNGEFYIPNYAGSTNKSVSLDMVFENNAALAVASLVAGLWSNTSAITSIKLSLNSGGNFVQHSTAYLYGISNA
jgi:hypothetical protein